MTFVTSHARGPNRRRRRKRFRSLRFECFENRLLLSASASSLAPLAETPLSPAVESAVRFRLEFTDLTGSPVRAIQAGDSFDVNVYVVDQRPLPQGVFAAYLDVLFDPSLVARAGEVTFGQSYTNVFASGGHAPGVLDEVGAVASFASFGGQSPAARESLLFRAPFRASGAGSVSFLTEPADRLPNSHVLLLGINEPIQQNDIAFESAALQVTSPSTRPPAATIETPIGSFASLQVTPVSLARSLVGSDVAILQLTTPPTSLRRIAPAAPELPIPGAFNRGVERRDEPWRLAEPSRAAGSLSREAADLGEARTNDDASGWIVLPIQPTPGGRRLRLPAARDDGPHRSRFEPRWLDAASNELQAERLVEATEQDDTRQAIWKRNFLRILWTRNESEQDLLGLSSEELVAQRMINIDEILNGGIGLHATEEVFDQLFAETVVDAEFKDMASHSVEARDTGDDDTQRPNAEPHLRAARGASLSLEVGAVTSDSPSAPPTDVPDASADAEQADAGPPPPREMHGEPPAPA